MTTNFVPRAADSRRLRCLSVPANSRLHRAREFWRCGTRSLLYALVFAASCCVLLGIDLSIVAAQDQQCRLSVCGGESGGGVGETGGGGGKGWWLYYRTTKPQGTGSIRGSLFLDLDGDGSQGSRERAGFAGLAVAVTGKDSAGASVSRSGVVGGDGTFALVVPVGTYLVTTQDHRGALRGYRGTNPSAVAGVSVTTGAVIAVNFGWRPDLLLDYSPCLRIRDAGDELPAPATAAEALLARLAGPAGSLVLQGQQRDGRLMTRRQFLTLLGRTQCLLGEPTLERPLGAEARPSPDTVSPAFSDLSFPTAEPLDDWARTIYGLRAAGIPVARIGTQGLLADGDAPILRREAVAAVAAILGPANSDGGSEVPVAPDTGPEDRPLVARLQALGILPAGFRVTMNGGVTWPEGATLLARAAFVRGKIDLASAEEPPWDPSARVPYLKSLPPIPRRDCIIHDPMRAGRVRLSSLTPGHEGGLWWRTKVLAGIGATQQGGSRVRWLLTGRPAEFGVLAGELPLTERTPVTRLGLVSALLVMACHPLESGSAAQARLSGQLQPVLAGTADQIAPTDRYAGTSDTAAFSARVFHSSQRPIRAYNLTVFRFAPELLRGVPRDPHGAPSVSEASRLLASAALYTRVQAGVLTAEVAERRAADLAASIAGYFLGVEGKAGVVQGARTPLTWGMLAHFLSDLLGPEVHSEVPAASPSLGEAWWETVRTSEN